MLVYRRVYTLAGSLRTKQRNGLWNPCQDFPTIKRQNLDMAVNISTPYTSSIFPRKLSHFLDIQPKRKPKVHKQSIIHKSAKFMASNSPLKNRVFPQGLIFREGPMVRPGAIHPLGNLETYEKKKTDSSLTCLSKCCALPWSCVQRI